MADNSSNKKNELKTPWDTEYSSRPPTPLRERPDLQITVDPCLDKAPDYQSGSESAPAATPAPSGCELHARILEDGGEPVVTAEGCSCEDLEVISEVILESRLCEDDGEED